MGQRLVIQITNNGETLANAYYHWSAYTEYAAELTNAVLGYLQDGEEVYKEPKRLAAWALYKTGARFNSEEAYNMGKDGINKEDYAFGFDGPSANRNDGLLCITDKGMDDNVKWEEHHVEIDLYSNYIYFDVIYAENAKEYIKYREEECDEHIDVNRLPTLDAPAYLEFNAKEWEKFAENIKKLYVDRQWLSVSTDKETIYELIA